MKHAYVPGLLEGIALPGLMQKKKSAFDEPARPIHFDAAEIAASAMIAQMRAKRGVK